MKIRYWKEYWKLCSLKVSERKRHLVLVRIHIYNQKIIVKITQLRSLFHKFSKILREALKHRVDYCIANKKYQLIWL